MTNDKKEVKKTKQTTTTETTTTEFDDGSTEVITITILGPCTNPAKPC